MVPESATTAVASGVESSAAMPSGVAAVTMAVGAAAALTAVADVGKAETGAAAFASGVAVDDDAPSSPQQAPSNRQVSKRSRPWRDLIQAVTLVLTLSGVRGLANRRSFIFVFLIIHSFIGPTGSAREGRF
jgi:hypothetical protein